MYIQIHRKMIKKGRKKSKYLVNSLIGMLLLLVILSIVYFSINFKEKEDSDEGRDMLITGMAIDDFESGKCLDFGSNENSEIWYNSSVMSGVLTDGSTEYRETLPDEKLEVKFPEFNVGSDEFPDTPMLLEIRYKDTYSDWDTLANRPVVSSYINFISNNPEVLKKEDRVDYNIMTLRGQNAGWKIQQREFQKSPFQLIRSIDSKFSFKITMPDRYRTVPIDYICLREITQSEYEDIIEQQKINNGFTEVDLGPDEPSSLPQYNDLTVFVRDIMRPVYLHTKPASNEINKEIELNSALGELEVASFAIYSESGVNSLSFEANELIHNQNPSDKIPISNINIQKIVYDERRLTHYKYNDWGANGKPYALIPDRVEDFNSLDVGAETSERIWIKIKIPENILGGLYEGSIKVKQAGNLQKTVPIKLNVLPIKLNHSEHINPLPADPFYRPFSPDLDDILNFYVEVEFDPSILMPWPQIDVKTTNGKITGFDSSRLEKNMQEMRDSGFLKDHVVMNLAFISSPIYTEIYNYSTSSSTQKPYLYDRLSSQEYKDAFNLD